MVKTKQTDAINVIKRPRLQKQTNEKISMRFKIKKAQMDNEKSA